MQRRLNQIAMYHLQSSKDCQNHLEVEKMTSTTNSGKTGTLDPINNGVKNLINNWTTLSKRNSENPKKIAHVLRRILSMRILISFENY